MQELCIYLCSSPFIFSNPFFIGGSVGGSVAVVFLMVIGCVVIGCVVKKVKHDDNPVESSKQDNALTILVESPEKNNNNADSPEQGKKCSVPLGFGVVDVDIIESIIPLSFNHTSQNCQVHSVPSF